MIFEEWKGWYNSLGDLVMGLILFSRWLATQILLNFSPRKLGKIFHLIWRTRIFFRWYHQLVLKIYPNDALMLEGCHLFFFENRIEAKKKSWVPRHVPCLLQGFGSLGKIWSKFTPKTLHETNSKSTWKSWGGWFRWGSFFWGRPPRMCELLRFWGVYHGIDFGFRWLFVGVPWDWWDHHERSSFRRNMYV